MSETVTLRFDDRVAVITGGGGALGRAYARLLAARGAKVVVNDIDLGQAESPAAKVASEIRAAGGQAIASTHSVERGEDIIADALNAFGRVDIVINNAGILRDRSFHKMSVEEWTEVHRVHLFGSFSVTRAAWPHMRDQRYGRVIMISSGAGLWGNFGQANYSSAKLGLHGLTLTLSHEGEKVGIKVNTVSPSAASALGVTMISPRNMAVMSPDLVSPVVAYLCHESCPISGGFVEAGVGQVDCIRFQRSPGVNFGVGGFSPEDVAAQWRDISDMTNAYTPASFAEVMAPFEKNLPEPLLVAPKPNTGAK